MTIDDRQWRRNVPLSFAMSPFISRYKYGGKTAKGFRCLLTVKGDWVDRWFQLPSRIVGCTFFLFLLQPQQNHTNWSDLQRWSCSLPLHISFSFHGSNAHSVCIEARTFRLASAQTPCLDASKGPLISHSVLCVSICMAWWTSYLAEEKGRAVRSVQTSCS